jgi:predicted ATPase
MALNQLWWVDRLAEAYAAAGRLEAALQVLGETTPADSMGGFLDSEHPRRRGLLLLTRHRDPADIAEAETCFRSAVEIARQRGARTPELRAATSLARLLQAQGRRDEARAALLELHRSFTEGLDTQDLVDARLLLESLT